MPSVLQGGCWDTRRHQLQVCKVRMTCILKSTSSQPRLLCGNFPARGATYMARRGCAHHDEPNEQLSPRPPHSFSKCPAVCQEVLGQQSSRKELQKTNMRL